MRQFAVTAAVTLAASLTLLPGAARADELTEFDTCAQIVDYAQESLSDGSYPEYVSSFDGSLDARTARRNPAEETDDDDTVQDAYGDTDDVVVQDEAAPASGKGSDDTSTTNNQEVGVDEPDVVKTNGRYVYVFAGNQLRIYLGRRDVPQLVGQRELQLAEGTLLRSGDKLLAIGQKPEPRRTSDDDASEPGASTQRYPEYDPQTVRFIEIDVRDPAQPRVLRTLDSPGRLITARAIGSTVRVVVDSEPDWDLYDYYDESEEEQEEFEEDIELDDLVPETRLKSAVSGSVYKRPMAACHDISHPAVASAGVELLSVFTFDLERGLIGIDRQGVMASPQVVYASTNTLYVGSARSTGWYYDDYDDCEDIDKEDDPEDWEDFDCDAWAAEEADKDTIPPNTYTDIYAFDTSEAGKTTYVGSGRVRGVPVNQYAFSEFGGDLRVASTTDPWWLVDEPEKADNRVTVLRRSGSGAGSLGQVGLLTGIGKGEEISAVRFFGERGYIATERDTAPLSTIDLSDPKSPALLGQIRLTASSGYLHPLGDDLVLGVGQERAKPYGAQVSLFDVSDPRKPRRLGQRILGRGWASTGYDPHAFLWWPRKQMVFVPFWGWSSWYDDDDEPGGIERDAAALVALRAKPGAGPNLTEIGRVLHGPDWDHPIPNRAIVMGPRLLSISDLGIAASRLDDLRPLGYTPFLYGWPVPSYWSGTLGTCPGDEPAPTTPVATTPGSTTPAAKAAATTPAQTTPTTPATTPAPTTPTTPATTPVATTPDCGGDTPTSTTPPPPTTPATTTPATTPATTP